MTKTNSKTTGGRKAAKVTLRLSLELHDAPTARLFSCLAEFYGIPADRLAAQAVMDWVNTVRGQLPTVVLGGHRLPADAFPDRRRS